jgi:hypothetical protein
VLHFDFIHTAPEAVAAVKQAVAAGAQSLTFVAPAHVWEDDVSQRALDAAVTEATAHHLPIIFSRMDACQSDGETDWLFAHALTKRGRMPDGRPSEDWFCTTVGNHAFERWQHDETAYYAQRYGRLPNLLAASVGGMVEPLVSERGSMFQWNPAADTYEIVQYTPEGLQEWHRWLRGHYGTLARVNAEYGTAFTDVGQIPMPRHGHDPRFHHAREAYFDLCQSFNDWFVAQYRTNRAIWHQYSATPFVLQLCGFDAEKIAHGRPEFAAFDLPAWVDDADAVAMSLYTFAGYADWGHASNVATLQLLRTARDAGKMGLIMECGCENPRVVLPPHEISFATRMGLLLDPQVYTYEYFRYSRDAGVEPGMMTSPSGVIHQPGYTVVREWLNALPAFRPVTPPPPSFYYLSVPRAARGNALAGLVNRAVYALAGYLPCRLLPWAQFARIPAAAVVLVPPGFQSGVASASLTDFLHVAQQAHWRLASDRVTCEALRRLAPGLRAQPIYVQALLRDEVEDGADQLYSALSAVPEVAQRVRALPVHPAPGVSWVQLGDQVFIWSETAHEITCSADAMREAHVKQMWGSTRDGQPLRLRLTTATGSSTIQTLFCRTWQVLK